MRERRSLASKSEQIAIARRVLAGRVPEPGWLRPQSRADQEERQGEQEPKPGYSASAKKLTKAEQKAKAAKIKKLKATKVATVKKKTHSLKKLAKHFRGKGGWKAVYELNQGKVKKSGKAHIKHGTRITLRT